MTLKEKIVLGRGLGFTYKKIGAILKCSKAVISYHLNTSVAEGNRRRMKKDRMKRGARKKNKLLIGQILSGLLQRNKV